MTKTYLSIATVCGMAIVPSFAGLEMEAGNGILKFTGGEGPGKGKHVVLIAGDEEYRSEESMPMLAKILTDKHGFDTTVLFSADEDGTINPKATKNLSGAETLDSADALILTIRFREWDDETMKRFEGAMNRGVPIIGLRTSTHAFKFPKGSPWEEWSFNSKTGGFGRTVLGETWISHWGHHKFEATRTVIEEGQEKNPLLNGVGSIYADSDVYEAAPPEDATILLRGLVLEGMGVDDGLSKKEKAPKGGKTQNVNNPAMPVAWSREVTNKAGTTNRVLTSTMGAATDFADEDMRRLVVNGVFWGLDMEVPAKADVSPVGEWVPSNYGYKDGKNGLKAADFAK
ncbi:MAG: ThuA domain-containing protein [Luteolibacter sp.]